MPRSNSRFSACREPLTRSPFSVAAARYSFVACPVGLPRQDPEAGRDGAPGTEMPPRRTHGPSSWASSAVKFIPTSVP